MKNMTAGAALLAIVALSSPARAADTVSFLAPEAQTTEQNGWTYSVTPYFWAAMLSGEIAQFNSPTVDVDASFSDILDNLDFAAMAIGEARNGRFSLVGDLIYTKLSSGSATPYGIVAESVDVQSSTFAALAGAGYSVLEGASGRLDVVAGLRVWSVNSEISFSGGILHDKTRGDGATWVDALVGVRGNYALTPQFHLMGWGLVGAGGADLDWDVAAGVGYRINDTFSATLGYRALGVDYSNDGFRFDVVQQGPIAGLTAHF
ncbi:hypothetical protein [Nordella sp. HKS 07]|uniref:hypothetical protein n=1 Tax=Nordella sp. HKS 07 TaxID=2712222 RepID=UPI00352FB10E